MWDLIIYKKTKMTKCIAQRVIVRLKPGSCLLIHNTQVKTQGY